MAGAETLLDASIFGVGIHYCVQARSIVKDRSSFLGLFVGDFGVLRTDLEAEAVGGPMLDAG